jgi:hypothetical protein
MRNRLAYGVPIAAGLATGGYALSQGEDPGLLLLPQVLVPLVVLLDYLAHVNWRVNITRRY